MKNYPKIEKALSRRKLIQIGLMIGLGSTLNSYAMSATPSEKLKLGLIFPPSNRGVPEEGITLYGDSIEFLIENLGLDNMTPEGYDSVVDLIPVKAENLLRRGAEAIVLMGTSLSFYQGESFNQLLTQQMQEVSGLPSITMSTAIIEGLKEVNTKRVSAATAYNDEVNFRLNSFLTEHGFDVLNIQGLGIEAIADIAMVTQAQLLDFGVEVFNSVEGADSILVSCGGLITLDILAPLEAMTHVPAISSTPHSLLAGAKLLGMSTNISGYGSLIAG
jgi:arylmalonate decarboxylase